MTTHTMKSASPSDATDRSGRLIARVRAAYAQRKRKRRDSMWLHDLSDHHLRDIGLMRSQIRAAVYGGSPA